MVSAEKSHLEGQGKGPHAFIAFEIGDVLRLLSLLARGRASTEDGRSLVARGQRTMGPPPFASVELSTKSLATSEKTNSRGDKYRQFGRVRTSQQEEGGRHGTARKELV